MRITINGREVNEVVQVTKIYAADGRIERVAVGQADGTVISFSPTRIITRPGGEHYQCEVQPARTLTSAEDRVLSLLGEAWNAYLSLPVVHQSDGDEFMRAIHAAQNIIMARPVTEARTGR